MNSTAKLPSLAERIVQLWNDSFAWLTSHSAQILLAAILGAVIVAILFGAKLLGERLCRGDPARSRWRSVIGKALATTRVWFMIVAAAQIVATYAHAPQDLAHTIYFLFVIAATLQSAIFVRELILGSIEHRASGHETLGSALTIIRLLVTAAVFSIALVLILSNLGVNVTGLVAGLGVGGIAIGLAAQGIFKDLFGALAILFDRPFRVGETIRFGDTTGRVEAIGLKTTRIRSIDGEQIIMSNNKLLDTQIHNMHGIAERRVVLTLPLHYANPGASLATIPDLLRAVVEGVPDCRFDHAWLNAFGDNAIKVELMFHVTKGAIEVRDAARHAVIAGAVDVLQKAGIAFSFQAALPDLMPGTNVADIAPATDARAPV
ncbi:mechanosensitive ion channel domain-containing protein [Sphingomonas sp.]|uniref:mechanosensitive ion channel family protein n=1 Tax=Sphingomonas sp. TaxID=28214 RepID=UPI0025E30F3B|nr:mechanosensitive ion channel domain-containing protein [Sphingomonas sp.]